MMRRFVRSCLCVLLSLSLMSVCVAQRSARGAVDLDSTGTSVEDDGKLYFTLPSGGQASVQTGVTVPGDISHVSGAWPNGDEVLVAGRDASAGVLEHWKFSTATQLYTLRSRYAFPPADFGSVAYDSVGDALYLLDVRLKVIWRNTWDGASNLPVSGWTVWADAQEVPDLNSSDDLEIGVIPAEGAEPLKVALVSRFAKSCSPSSGSQLYRSGGSMVVDSWPAPALPKVIIDSRSMSEGLPHLTVVGVSGTSFLVMRHSTGTVIGSGTIPIGGNSAAITATESVVIGESYVAYEVGKAPSAEMCATAIRRYGYGETLGDGSQIGHIAQPLNFPVGSTRDVYCPIVGSSVQVGDCPFVGNVAFGYRDPSTGVDPVVAYGNNMLLATSLFLPLAGLTLDSSGAVPANGYMRTTVDIPNDPNLIGTVLLFQFWVIDGATVKVSEIAGVQLEGEPAAAAAGAGLRQVPPEQILQERLKSTSGLREDAKESERVQELRR